MNTKKTMTFLTITAAGMAVSAASAADYTWDGSASSAWNNLNNWQVNGMTPGALPDADDDVVIPSVGALQQSPILNTDATINSLNVRDGGLLRFEQSTARTLTIDDATLDVDNGGQVDVNFAGSKIILQAADALEINAGGLVDISAAGELRLTAASSSGNPIDGELKLSASGAQLSVQQDITFTGSGSVIGENDAAKVEISASRTFTTEIDVEGALQIDGLSSVNPGTFKLDNGAMVHADGNVTDKVIEFMVNTILADSDTNDAEVFKASNGGELQFSRAATDLAAAFEIDSGVFDFHQDITTSGDLTCSSPTIEVAMGKVFTWLFGRTGQDSLDDSGSPYTTCP